MPSCRDTSRPAGDGRRPCGRSGYARPRRSLRAPIGGAGRRRPAPAKIPRCSEVGEGQGRFILAVIRGAQETSASHDVSTIFNKVAVAWYFTEQLLVHEISYSNNQPSAIDAEAHLAIAATDSTPSSVLAQRHEIDSFLPGLLTSVALKPGPEEAEIAIGMNSGDLALHAACEDGTGTGSMDATTKEDDASVILARLVTSPGDDVMLVGSATFWSMDQSEIREQVAY